MADQAEWADDGKDAPPESADDRGRRALNMARVPVVDSPCPIAGRPLPAGATDHCSQCERTVHNLNRMSERERRDFMSRAVARCAWHTR